MKKRKQHYNEFQAAKMAREQIRRELEELEQEDANNTKIWLMHHCPDSTEYW